MTEQKFLNASQLVARWNNAVTVGTLANWRCQGKGPPVQRVGNRVLYPIDKLVIWENQNQTAHDNDNQGPDHG
jgi:hypothetical protein